MTRGSALSVHGFQDCLWQHTCCSVSKVLSGTVPCCALTLTGDQGLLAKIPLMCLEGMGALPRWKCSPLSCAPPFPVSFQPSLEIASPLASDCQLPQPALPSGGQTARLSFLLCWDSRLFFYCEDEIIVLA